MSHIIYKTHRRFENHVLSNIFCERGSKGKVSVLSGQKYIPTLYPYKHPLKVDVCPSPSRYVIDRVGSTPFYHIHMIYVVFL